MEHSENEPFREDGGDTQANTAHRRNTQRMHPRSEDKKLTIRLWRNWVEKRHLAEKRPFQGTYSPLGFSDGNQTYNEENYCILIDGSLNKRQNTFMHVRNAPRHWPLRHCKSKVNHYQLIPIKMPVTKQTAQLLCRGRERNPHALCTGMDIGTAVTETRMCRFLTTLKIGFPPDPVTLPKIYGPKRNEIRMVRESLLKDGWRRKCAYTQ